MNEFVVLMAVQSRVFSESVRISVATGMHVNSGSIIKEFVALRVVQSRVFPESVRSIACNRDTSS